MKKIILGLLVCNIPAISLSASRRCTKFTTIETVPYVITEPGKYILCRNVTHVGAGPAITIASSNVELCLFARNITLTNPAATGILVNKGEGEENQICCIKINNDSIENVFVGAQTGSGIHIRNACKVHLDNMFTVNHGNGLLIENSEDIFVEHSNFSSAQQDGARIRGSSIITFEKSTFQDNNTSIFCETSELTGCRDFKISNCSFPNALLGIHLDLRTLEGMLLANSTFSITELTALENYMVLLGTGVPLDNVNTVGIKFCTFSSSLNIQGVINYLGGTGLNIDASMFELSSEDEGSLIRLATGSSAVQVKNCILKTTLNRNGITAQGSSALIQKNIFQDFSFAVRINGANQTTVDQCVMGNGIAAGVQINGGANVDNVISDCLILSCQNDDGDAAGILMPTITSRHNVIKNNIIVNNSEGIILSGSNNTIVNNDVILNRNNGIQLFVTALANSVQRNRSHSNNTTGFIQDGLLVDNEFYYNTAHFNGVQFANIPVVKNPGTPTKEASNIEPA